jgi:hypothetical protein
LFLLRTGGGAKTSTFFILRGEPVWAKATNRLHFEVGGGEGGFTPEDVFLKGFLAGLE